MRSFPSITAPWSTLLQSGGSMGPPEPVVRRSTDATLGSGTLAYESRFILPLDILFLVFMECDIRTLVTCRLVCKNFDVFITNQRTLLYKLALALERHMDSSWNGASSPSLTSLQKLQRLRRQSLAWRGELPSALKLEIPVTRPDSIYELNGGIFALGDTHNGGMVAFPAMNLPDGIEGARLDFVKLPSVIAGNLGVEWGHISLGQIQVVDFTMNVDMDLLVLIEKKRIDSERTHFVYRVHLMSLSQSTAELEPHPLTHSAVLEHPCHPDWSDYQIEFSIYEDHVGLLMNSAQSASFDRLVVWNWKDGTKAAKHSAEILETFVFLREGLVLVPSYTTGSLDILSYTPSEEVGTFQPILSFPLPTPSAGLDYLYILVRSQPTGRSNYSKRESLRAKTSQPPSVPSSSEQAQESSNLPPRSPHTPGPLDDASVPFSPSIDDAIIVASTRVAPVVGQPGDSWAGRVLPDCEGTLVIKKSTFLEWIRWWEEMEPIPLNIDTDVVPTAPSIYAADEPSPTASDVTSDGSPGLPHRRSQGVQTSPELQAPDGACTKIVVPWHLWGYRTRWLRDKEAPRWVRDVHGMRFATRVKDVPPAFLPSYQNPPAGAYQSGAIGSLPTMQQLWNTPVINTSSEVIPPTATSTPQQAATELPQTQLPSLSGLFVQQQQPPSTSLPLPLPPPVLPQDTATDAPRYRTRICDFNQKPYVRVPNAVPYPGHIPLDLSIDYGELGVNDEAAETRPAPLTEAQAHVKRNIRYIKKKRNADGNLTCDRGWSVIRQEHGLEWTRRPVWEDTVIHPGVTYAEKICTGMPYLEITSTAFNDCTSLMMDAERIIGMKTDDALNLTSLEVLVI